MRHRKSGLKLNRTSSHRKAMFRNMVTSLLKYERIKTTDAKAKELKSWADHIITLAKRGDLHARRQALSYIMDKSVTHKLFDEMSNRFSDRQGGYTRILKTGHRKGDNAPLAIIQLLLSSDKKKELDKKVRGTAKSKKEIVKKEIPDKKAVSKGKMQASEGEQEKVEKK